MLKYSYSKKFVRILNDVWCKNCRNKSIDQQNSSDKGSKEIYFLEEMATHSSILAWKSPWTEEPGGLQSMGLHDWARVHEGGGRWVGSNKLVELKRRKEMYFILI